MSQVNTAICPLCNGVSWSSTAPASKTEIARAVGSRGENTCSCAHVLDTEVPDLPPKAGTGERKKSISGWVSSWLRHQHICNGITDIYNLTTLALYEQEQEQEQEQQRTRTNND
ncbi:hypothetical protein JL09_g5500 [Pichia kudriavzevii]|uniref:Uncharacterized protein n=1 Tax=Pichia kudriavzevii TaxID=4909 RepID=A0A099NS20_PICKU|nr:hypothetical protein JL09_g5500 [Pichia kudriavzevii]